MMTRSAFLMTALALSTSCLAGEPLRTQQEKSPIDQLIERIKAIPGQADKPFSMIVQFKVKRDQVDAVMAAAKKAVPASRAEKGCIVYDVQQNLEDATEIFVLETWRDAKALQFHAGTEHFAEFIKVIQPAVEEAPQMRLTKAAISG
jgi:quinol monooxygenase YgiN